MIHSGSIALTMGEPAGIGGELTLKTWSAHRQTLPVFFAIDCPQRLEKLAARLNLNVPIVSIEKPQDADSIFQNALPVLPQSVEYSEPGSLSDKSAPSVIASIERAVGFCQTGQARAVVTNPIHKSNLKRAGFSFPGHTEFLAHLWGLKTPPIMMLACDELKVVPLTVHVSLQQAIAELSIDLIVEKSLITAKALQDRFQIERPRLAFAGLNPHAGEDGTMGLEEIEIIAPALKILRTKGLDAIGPLPPDTMFHKEARARYDVAMCMYHDQALIPLKTLAFDLGVNVTLGLPFVRTSPDHGTALDIAGTGQASENSLCAALKMADRMSMS